MSDPLPTPDKTPARFDALKSVVLGLISYNPLVAQYLQGGQPITGARGRTFRELRSDFGLIKPGSSTRVAKVLLTEAGEQVAIEWGLKLPEADAEQQDSEPAE